MTGEQTVADDSGKSFIFFALYVPDADPETDDADDLAEAFVAIINEERQRCCDIYGQPDYYKPVMVAGIPSPQFLNPQTLANLRAAANTTADEREQRQRVIDAAVKVRHATVWLRCATRGETPDARERLDEALTELMMAVDALTTPDQEPQP